MPEGAKTPSDAADATAGAAIELTADPKKPGSYSLGSQTVSGGGGSDKESPAETTETFGITVELQDEDGQPVYAMPAGDPVKFRIKVAGKTYEGTLNNDGVATVTGLPEKACEVSFPEIDGSEWK